jgi:hypothetical protein
MALAPSERSSVILGNTIPRIVNQVVAGVVTQGLAIYESLRSSMRANVASEPDLNGDESARPDKAAELGGLFRPSNTEPGS